MKSLFMILKVTLLSILSISIVNCTSNNKSDYHIKDIKELYATSEITNKKLEKEQQLTFISVKSKKEQKLSQKVSINTKNINLITAIDFIDSSLSVSADKGVDIEKTFSVKFNNQTLDKYFDYLHNITGYEFELIDSVIYIRSIQTKTWHLQTLSLNSITLSNAKSEISVSDNTAPAIVENEENDDWKEIVSHVKTIMNSDGLFINQKALVTDNKQLGIITAIGLPIKIKQVDNWIDNLVSASNKQVHMQVQVLDVVVDESVGKGIDWSLIKDSTSKFQVGSKSEQTVDGAGIISIGTGAGGLIKLGNNVSLEFMLNFLQKQGKVRVDNQPNITITNGKKAYITTGDEFSFVASINSATDAQGQITTTSDIQRMKVGVDMNVTPKILPDNRIVLSVVPIISSLKSFTTLSSGNQTFQTPNIALQKLATQVIVESGKTIHLGGLIASKIINATKGLPNSGFWDSFFRGTQESVERREIVILITPTIVN